jgi:thioredoxin 1
MPNDLESIRMKKMEAIMAKIGKKSMPNKPIKATDDTIDKLINKYPVVVIDCWAPWCGPCQIMSPVIDELANEMQGKVVFLKLNTDENKATASRFNVMSIPTLFLFKDGRLVDSSIGVLPPDLLRDWVERYT